MRHPFRPMLALALLALALLALLAPAGGCGSKKSSPTAPPPAGGGPSFNFSFASVGTSHSITFPNEGHFGYHCAPHRTSGMTGTVHVTSGAADSATVDVGPNGTTSFAPATVSIKPGGTVRWVRPGTSSLTNHTATND